MPPPPRCVSVWSDDDSSSDEVSQVHTPPITSESDCGEDMEGASQSDLCQHVSKQAATLHRQIKDIQATLQNADLCDSEVTYWNKKARNLLTQLTEVTEHERCQQCSSSSPSIAKASNELLAEPHQPGTASKKHSRSATVTALKKSKTKASASNGIKGLDVTNLSSAINASQLRQEFERFGDIINCHIFFNSTLDWSKAVGYVRFANAEDAARAKVDMDYYTLNGRMLRVYFSTRKLVDENSPAATEEPSTSETDVASRSYDVPAAQQGSTSESSRAQEMKDAKKSQAPGPQPSYAVSTLQTKIKGLEKVLRHTPRLTPERRQGILGRRLDEIYLCYLTLKDINRELRWSDLPPGSLESLKGLLHECLQTTIVSKRQVKLADSIAAEEKQGKLDGLEMFGGAVSMQRDVENNSQDGDFELASDVQQPQQASAASPANEPRKPIYMVGHPKAQNKDNQAQWRPIVAQFTNTYQSTKNSTLQADRTSRRYALPPVRPGGWPDELETEIPSSDHQTPLEKIFPNGSPQLATFEQVRQQLRGVQISDADDWELDGGRSEGLVSDPSWSTGKRNDRPPQNVYNFFAEDTADAQALVTSLETEIGRLNPSEAEFVSRWRNLSNQCDLACHRYVQLTGSDPDQKWTLPKFTKSALMGMHFEVSPSCLSDMQWALDRVNVTLGRNAGADNPFTTDCEETKSCIMSKLELSRANEAISHLEGLLDKSPQWTSDQDEALVMFRTSKPSEPWATIAKELGKTGHECKERHRAIEVERLVAKLPKKLRAKLAKQEAIETADSERLVSKHAKKKLSKKEKKTLKEKSVSAQKSAALGAGTDGVVETNLERGPWDGIRLSNLIGSPPRSPSLRSVEHNGQGYRVQSTANDGWGCAEIPKDFDPATYWTTEAEVKDAGNSVWEPNDPNFYEQWCSGIFARSDSTPKPASLSPKPYSVTYWATVECDGKEVHIPINSDNVSGPEKAVLDGPAKTVWKWAQEKGLCDKISLRDAFDLAKDMTVGSDEAEGAQEDEGKWQAPIGYTSRTVSPSSLAPPPSGSWPSPPVVPRAWGYATSPSPPPRPWGRGASPSPAPSLQGMRGGGFGVIEDPNNLSRPSSAWPDGPAADKWGDGQ